MSLPAPALLLAASAAVTLLLGSVHLLFTFHGNRLHPRDAWLRKAMDTGLPVLTRETTMWRAWIGFNASHSYGAMLFGLVYGHLAVAHPALLLGSPFLLSLGLALLLAYVQLARRYWFSVPFRGLLLSAALYAGALVLLIPAQ
jgi:hypothetical protein